MFQDSTLELASNPDTLIHKESSARSTRSSSSLSSSPRGSLTLRKSPLASASTRKLSLGVPRLPDDETDNTITSVGPPKMPTMTFPLSNSSSKDSETMNGPEVSNRATLAPSPALPALSVLHTLPVYISTPSNNGFAAPSVTDSAITPSIANSAVSTVSAASTANSLPSISTSLKSTSTTSSIAISTIAHSLPADPATTRTEASAVSISGTTSERLNQSLDTIDQLLAESKSAKKILRNGTETVIDHIPEDQGSSDDSGSFDSTTKVPPSPRPESFFMSSIRSFASSMTGTNSTSPKPEGSAGSIAGSEPPTASPFLRLEAEDAIAEETEETDNDDQSTAKRLPAITRSPVTPRSPSKSIGSAISSSVDDYDHSLYIAEKYLDTQYRFASEKRDSSFHSVFPNISSSERLLDDFSCALSREILLQGRLYVSEHYVCFNSNLLGWITSVVISLDEIVRFDRRSTAGLFPNGIVIETKDSKHSFASFISRDQTLNFLSTIWSKSVALSKMHNEQLRDTDLVESTLSVHSNSSNAKLSESDILTIDEDEDEDEEDETDNDEEDSSESLTSEIISQHENKYHIKGPLQHKPTVYEPDLKENDEQVILDYDFDAPLGYVFKSLFGKDTSLHQKIMKLSEGFDFSDYSIFETVPDCEKPVRKFEYQKRLNFSIGPKSTTVEVAEYLEHVDFTDYIEVLTVTRTPNVPSGGAFHVRTRYIFTWGPKSTTNLKCSYWVNWTSSSWIKGMIERATVTGQKKSAEDLRDLLLTEVPDSRDVYSEETLEESQQEAQKNAELLATKTTNVVIGGKAKVTAKHRKRRQSLSSILKESSTPLICCFVFLLVFQIAVLGYLYHASKVMNRILETQNSILRLLLEEGVNR
ncbi:DEKNAAC100554 [Brettanomyces naardenensis]|uniref:DEKNAAC100554 n=1 Tax=Brettanomyces naardenensis TaxID=13370 RepID=A0A448YF05_BRENA|nr:DEKNAAC100554 [Brettanomyces naardenensis]